MELYSSKFALWTSCWVALGWATAEVVASIVQGYEHLCLYAEYPDPDQDPDGLILEAAESSMGRDESLEMLNTLEVVVTEDLRNLSEGSRTPEVLSQYIDEQLSDLMNMKKMFEVEAAYGCRVTVCPPPPHNSNV